MEVLLSVYQAVESGHGKILCLGKSHDAIQYKGFERYRYTNNLHVYSHRSVLECKKYRWSQIFSTRMHLQHREILKKLFFHFFRCCSSNVCLNCFKSNEMLSKNLKFLPGSRSIEE